MVDGQQPTFVSGIPPTFPLRTSSLYSLCLRRISPLEQEGFKNQRYWLKFTRFEIIYINLFCCSIASIIGLSLPASTRPLGQWPPCSKSSGPGLIAVWLTSTLPPILRSLTLIIHPREQLDWGEPDDRWTVSPDCAGLIEERVQRAY